MNDATRLIAKARRALNETYGFADFRPGQEEILAATFAGEDVLAVMPTGAGKSLCYQLPALARGGLTLVVSPLIALMRDQVAQLDALGISAAALNSASEPDERRRVAAGLRDRSLRLLYVAPERLLRDDTLETLRGAVDLLAIDEAHCVSQWGHDFRPEYLRLREASAALGDPQILAVTATADAPTRADIAQRLFARTPRVFLRSFDRPNIFLAMRPKANATRQLIERLDAHPSESGIVYCASRRRADELAREFSERGRQALPYHAGLDNVVRSRNQDIFLQEDGVVICATIAFGMGIDKPDVRFVLHADMPSSIESYYQEIGRAGRDGLPAEAFALYSAGDIELRRRQIAEGGAPDARKRIETAKLDALVALCETARCRRQTLLAAFGEDSAPCGHCDVCQGAVRLIDGSLEAQKALSAVLRTSGRFFFGHLANILSGKKSEAIERHGHDQLKTFGVGADRAPAEWRGVLRQLLSARLIERDGADRDRLVVTEDGRKVLKGEAPFALREDVVAKKARRDKRAAAHAAPGDADAELLAALKALRGALAKAQKQPAYVVFPDRSLIEMAATKPASLNELGRVHGVGAAKLARYGSAFLAVIRERVHA
ncbi:MAG: DNA helicase RecQ [Roseiarcus sp.]|uniref:DNA helicase RecQ n=1 Tax=Roseiarcus sp. TaxID=1969460 RepID=UPI003C163266